MSSDRASLICLVVDRAGLAGGDDGPTERVRALIEAGVDWLQVRDRTLEADALYDFTRALVAGARSADRPARVIVNRRADVALAAGADGVHLGFDALPIDAARSLVGPGALIGVSCHSVDEVRAAVARGADYAHLAPIFDPISKPPERTALGAQVLTGLPGRVIAQGGLTEQNAASARTAGAAGIAVTGHVLQARDPVAAVRSLRAALDVD